MRKTIVMFFLSLLWLGLMAQQDDRADRNELSRAEHFLKKLEAQAARAKGQPFKPNYESSEALKRIKALKERYPNDPAVEELFQRASAAYMTSKGDFVTITPEMLEYRQLEKKLADLFFKEADREWQAFMQEINSVPGQVLKAFPTPAHRNVAIADVEGKYVALEEFSYPTNAFFGLGEEYVFVGSGTRGYYFVEISDRNWLGPYEAVKRYRRLINSDVPEGGPWTLVGRITGSHLLVPQAEKEKTMPAHWGWTVEPVAIYVPERTFARYDANAENGAYFAGEGKMESIKDQFYSVRTIPSDVTPERLLEIFAIAIKEKNFPLYLDCISPERKKTPRAMSRIRYHWDLHQERFARLYVHVTVEEAEIEVLKGYDSANEFDNFFLTAEQRQTAEQISEPLVEEAWVVSKAWDERGRQYGSPKPHQLRRRNKERWYIEDYAQQF